MEDLKIKFEEQNKEEEKGIIDEAMKMMNINMEKYEKMTNHFFEMTERLTLANEKQAEELASIADALKTMSDIIVEQQKEMMARK